MKKTIMNLVLLTLLIFSLCLGCIKRPEDIQNNQSNIPANLIKIGSITQKEETNSTLVCHYTIKLTKESPYTLNTSKILIYLELVDSKISDPEKNNNDWAMVKINNDKTVTLLPNENIEVSFLNNVKINFQLTLTRDANAVICINTNENYDITYCESKEATERRMCFDNLGYINGEEYCEQIQNPDDKRMCVSGATGTNG